LLRRNYRFEEENSFITIVSFLRTEDKWDIERCKSLQSKELVNFKSKLKNEDPAQQVF
jgi:hypothetical protein